MCSAAHFLLEENFDFEKMFLLRFLIAFLQFQQVLTFCRKHLRCERNYRKKLLWKLLRWVARILYSCVFNGVRFQGRNNFFIFYWFSAFSHVLLQCQIELNVKQSDTFLKRVTGLCELRLEYQYLGSIAFLFLFSPPFLFSIFFKIQNSTLQEILEFISNLAENRIEVYDETLIFYEVGFDLLLFLFFSLLSSLSSSCACFPLRMTALAWRFCGKLVTNLISSSLGS